MSLALALFKQLCDVGNALEYYRDLHAPGSDDWTALTEILGLLDLSIDRLVRSNGIDDEDNDAL
jgi:hypothetical protein